MDLLHQIRTLEVFCYFSKFMEFFAVTKFQSDFVHFNQEYLMQAFKGEETKQNMLKFYYSKLIQNS